MQIFCLPGSSRCFKSCVHPSQLDHVRVGEFRPCKGDAGLALHPSFSCSAPTSTLFLSRAFEEHDDASTTVVSSSFPYIVGLFSSVLVATSAFLGPCVTHAKNCFALQQSIHGERRCQHYCQPPSLVPGQRVRTCLHTSGAGRPVVDERAWRPPPTQRPRP